jgi:hypothetical protein
MPRCYLYKYRSADSDPGPGGTPGTYFVICSTGADCPPMGTAGADNVSWWNVDDCSKCTVPAGLPIPAPAHAATPPTEPQTPQPPQSEPSKPDPTKPTNVKGKTTHKMPIGPFHRRPDGIHEDPSLTWYGGTGGFQNGTRLTWNDLHVTVKTLLPARSIASITVTKISSGQPVAATAQSSTGKSDANGEATDDINLNTEIGPDDEFPIEFQTPSDLKPPAPSEVELVIQPTRDHLPVS